MTRRQLGLILMTGVAVLVMVVANIRPVRVAVSAVSAPVAGVPTVGDCVLDPLPVSPVTVTPANAATPSPSFELNYPRQQIGPCSGTRYGEVADMIQAPRAPVMAGDTNNRYIDDLNMDRCYEAAPRYLGLSAEPIATYWLPFLQSITAISQPSVPQQAAGQHWVACIVGLPPTSGSSGRVTDAKYGSTLRDALHTGAARDQLGSCLEFDDRELGSGIDCGRPHALEILAFGNTSGSPADRAGDCELPPVGAPADRHGRSDRRW